MDDVREELAKQQADAPDRELRPGPARPAR
jgi:hypothetical protein